MITISTLTNQNTYIPKPLVEASQQAHKVEIRNEIQPPVFGEILNRARAEFKNK